MKFRKKLLVFLLLFTGIIQITHGQVQNSVKGNIIDSVSNIVLKDVSVSIINESDSILVQYTRSLHDGSFSFTGLQKGKFILLITSPDHADFTERFEIHNGLYDFKRINLTKRAIILAEILIQGKVSKIQIKGDTTEYNAKGYVIEPNAKVEDLLKQFSGIQVDRDGKIRAQGQIVNKVLVDGEEFFGDDPTLVTKNIRADMVDKIQLYDKKSDLAILTGVDDGVKTKTLNVKLKEDKKQGFFGKLDGGVGTKDFYNTQGLFNAFKDKQKISLFAAASNTGNTGLSQGDNTKFSFNSQAQVPIAGIISLVDLRKDDFESFDGRYNGQGLPISITSGIHYDNKWDKDKKSINTNFKTGFIGVEGIKAVTSQNNLPTNIFSTNTDQFFDNSLYQSRLDLTSTTTIDSLSSIKISFDGLIKKGETNNVFNVLSKDQEKTLYRNQRELSYDENQSLLNFGSWYTKKFKKTGRTMVFNFMGSSNTINTNGSLNSTTDLFNDQGLVDEILLLNQSKKNKLNSTIFSTNGTYSEPLSKNLSVLLNVGLSYNVSNSDRRSFNLTSEGTINDLDSIASNDFNLDQLLYDAGAILNYKMKKSTINFGTKIISSKYFLTNNFTQIKQSRNFFNWMPQLNYVYRFTNYTSISFNYSGTTIQPNINQIQPVFINDDPLNITLGNSLLKPSFNNRISSVYQSYKVLNNRFFSITGSYVLRQSPIVYNTFADENGRNVFVANNINKSSRIYNVTVYYNKKIKEPEIYGGFHLGLNGNTFYSMVNDVLNRNFSQTISGDINLSQTKPNKYSFLFLWGPNFRTLKNSLQTSSSNNEFGFNGYFNFSVYLPFKIELKNDFNYEYNSRTKSFDNDLNRILVNTAVNRKFLKNQNLKLSLSVNDLFNQNQGLSRFISNNLIVQNTYNTIQRYYMVSLTYDYNKMKSSK